MLQGQRVGGERAELHHATRAVGVGPTHREDAQALLTAGSAAITHSEPCVSHKWFFSSVASACAGLLCVIAIVTCTVVQHWGSPERLCVDPHYGGSRCSPGLLPLRFLCVSATPPAVFQVKAFLPGAVSLFGGGRLVLSWGVGTRVHTPAQQLPEPTRSVKHQRVGSAPRPSHLVMDGSSMGH